MLTTTLFLFLFIFGGIGLMVWAGIVYSNKRWYGKNSPLKVTQTFKISAWQYFTRPDFVFFVLAYIGFFALLILMFQKLPMSPDLVWGYFLIFVAVIAFFGYLGIKHISLQLHYWEHTKNMKIVTVPEEKVVLVSDGKQQLRLKKGDIEEIYGIGVVSNRGVSYSYFVYYLKNGNSFVLTEPMPGRWVLEDYLGYVEPQLIQKSWPRIEHLPLISVVAS